MKMQIKLLLLLTTGLFVGCTDNEPTEQSARLDTASVPVTESDIPVADDSGVPTTDDSATPEMDSTCIDLVSDNADWSDNCVLSTNQPYSRSTYLLGVQRILWCVEAFTDATLTITQSTDGIYAGKTEEAVRRYQTRHVLSSSGAVDSSTWRQLQQELILVGAAAAEYSSFAIAGARCGEQIHFYQRNTPPHDWKIAAQPGSTELLDFSALEFEL